MLEGKTVNLRVEEKEDLPYVAEWLNSLRHSGEYVPLMQASKAELEKQYEHFSAETKYFMIEKKDGTRIGTVVHFVSAMQYEIGYTVIPSERSKGYASEAIQIIVDYLFLSKDINRVQAFVDQRNVPSVRVIEKAGFKREATLRKAFFMYGEWRDMWLYGILREEWKEPRILTKQ
jgi:RimJ/RimL family protein N-acetyltransferase